MPSDWEQQWRQQCYKRNGRIVRVDAENRIIYTLLSQQPWEEIVVSESSDDICMILTNINQRMRKVSARYRSKLSERTIMLKRMYEAAFASSRARETDGAESATIHECCWCHKLGDDVAGAARFECALCQWSYHQSCADAAMAQVQGSNELLELVGTSETLSPMPFQFCKRGAMCPLCVLWVTARRC